VIAVTPPAPCPAATRLRDGRIAAASLALVAGFVDAYGYLGWHVFGANMTGNTVLFAISLHSKVDQAYLPLTLIVLFFVGTVLGRAIMERFESYAALYAEAGLLAAAAFTPGYPALPIISLAMGMQNTALSTFAGVSANTSFLSGDYTRLGQALADIATGRAGDRDQPTISIIWPLIITYAFGALVGAFCYRIPFRVLLVVPVVTILAIITHRKLLNPS
jgi:uncharacterized membrane protein YoaK (UPF0700 family)